MGNETILLLQAAIAVVFGVLILIWPRLLNYAVGLYLIIFGVLGLIRYWPS
jgi:uncharacterized membrane protein HdeD (DUF308 family)